MPVPTSRTNMMGPQTKLLIVPFTSVTIFRKPSIKRSLLFSPGQTKRAAEITRGPEKKHDPAERAPPF